LHPLSTGDLSFDSNTVVDFHLTGNVALLDTLFSGRAHTSDFVEAELAEAQITWPTPKGISLSEDAELQLLAKISKNSPMLGQGEVGAITVAFLHGMAFLSNDRAARQAATELGLKVFGSLAILHYGAECGVISRGDAINILCQIVVAGGYFSSELVETFKIDVLKEDPKER
jgi:predicted nucleic acid-binding protein